MNEMRCHSQKDFDDLCVKLEAFALGGLDNRRIVLDANDRLIDTSRKSCWLTRVIKWLKRVFTCASHPGHKAANVSVEFFRQNQQYIKAEHAVAIGGIRKIKHVKNKEAVDKAINDLLKPLGEVDRKEVDAKFDDARARARSECDALIKEATKAHTAAQKALSEAQAAQVRSQAEQAEELAQTLEAARQIRTNAETYRNDQRNAAEKTLETARAQAAQEVEQIQRKQKEAEQAAFEAERKKTDGVVENATAQAAVMSKETDQQNVLAAVEHDKAVQHRKGAEEALLRARKNDCDSRLDALKAKLAEKETALRDAKAHHFREHKKGTESSERQVNEGRILGKKHAEDGEKEATAIRAKAEEDAKAILKQKAHELEGEAKKGEAQRQEAEGKIEALKQQVDQLEREKKELSTRVQALKDAPATLICRDGEIANVSLGILKDKPFFTSKLTWKAKPQAKPLVLPGVEGDVKGGVAGAVVVDDDFAHKFLEAHEASIDVKLYTKDVVGYALEVFKSGKLPGKLPEKLLGLFCLASDLKSDLLLGACIAHLEKVESRDVLLLALHKSIDPTFPHPAFPEYAFNRVSDKLMDFAFSKSLPTLAPGTIAKLLKRCALSEKDVVNFIGRWLNGRSIDLLRQKKEGEESIWDVVRAKFPHIDQNKFILGVISPRPVAALEADKKENVVGAVKFQNHDLSGQPCYYWKPGVIKPGSTYSPVFDHQGHKFRFYIVHGEVTRKIVVECVSSKDIKFKAQFIIKCNLYDISSEYVELVDKNSMKLQLNTDDISDIQNHGIGIEIFLDPVLALAQAKVEADNKEDIGNVVKYQKHASSGVNCFCWALRDLHSHKEKDSFSFHSQEFNYNGHRFKLGLVKEYVAPSYNTKIIVECVSSKDVLFKANFRLGNELYKDGHSTWITKDGKTNIVTMKVHVSNDLLPLKRADGLVEIGIDIVLEEDAKARQADGTSTIGNVELRPPHRIWNIPNMRDILSQLSVKKDHTFRSPEFTHDGDKYQYTIQLNPDPEKINIILKRTRTSHIKPAFKMVGIWIVGKNKWNYDCGIREGWIIPSNEQFEIQLDRKPDIEDVISADGSYGFGVDILT